MENKSYFEDEQSISLEKQNVQENDELNFHKRETVTVQKIRELLAEKIPDWERIKNTQSGYLLMLTLQNLFSLWLLLLLYLMKLGQQIADQIKFPVDIVFLFIYLFTLIQIQFKQDDWRFPPFNYLLYIGNSVSRILLSILVIFKYPYIHLEIVYIMITIDFMIVFLFFQYDKKHKQQCFLAKDYWWRAIIIFMIQEILVNLIYAVYTWWEVFIWFVVYFLILCYVLWECQLIRKRPHINFYFNAFYLGQIYFDSDVLFPCSLIQLFRN